MAARSALWWDGGYFCWAALPFFLFLLGPAQARQPLGGSLLTRNVRQGVERPAPTTGEERVPGTAPKCEPLGLDGRHTYSKREVAWVGEAIPAADDGLVPWLRGRRAGRRDVKAGERRKGELGSCSVLGDQILRCRRERRGSIPRTGAQKHRQSGQAYCVAAVVADS